MADTIRAALLSAVNPADPAHVQALGYLEQCQQADLTSYLATLATELQNTGNPPELRALAGLQLKNALVSKDEDVARERQEMWLKLAGEARIHIRNAALNSLGTESGPSAAAQVISAIALAEIPEQQSLDLVPMLLSKMVPGSPDVLKGAVLECIGYICQGIEPSLLIAHANDVLTAIASCTSKETASNHVRMVAMSALSDALEFCEGNFNDPNERTTIMTMVCSCCLDDDIKVKVASLECLNRIVSIYYKFMPQYMAEGLYPITIKAMGDAEDEVALQGIEFWSTICDEEIELEEMAQEAKGAAPEEVSFHFTKGALEHLIPTLLSLLTRQTENDDSDEWNVSKAALVCLTLCAVSCREILVPSVTAFVQENISHPAWQNRDAAVLSFGALCDEDGPDLEDDVVLTMMGFLLGLMVDPKPQVRDSVAWCIGQLCEVHPHPIVINQECINALVPALGNSLMMEPRVAANVCWAFNSLVESAYREVLEESPTGKVKTFALSPFFGLIVEKLLEIAERPDSSEEHLRMAAYEAVMAYVQNFAEDCYPVVVEVGRAILTRLKSSLGIQADTAEAKLRYTDLQSQLCALVQALLRCMTIEDAVGFSNEVVTIILAMIPQASDSNNVLEDALMALSAVFTTCESHATQYLEAVKPVIISGLQKADEFQVCFAAVGLVGDVCRAVAGAAAPHCAEFMQHLLFDLGSDALHRSVKPHIISCIGDVALAVGPDFIGHLPQVAQVLRGAAEYSLQIEASKLGDYDYVDYINELRVSYIECYTGILQGLKGPDEQHPCQAALELLSHFVDLQHYVYTVLEDMVKTDDVNVAFVSTCLGFFGDFCHTFTNQLTGQISEELMAQLLHIGDGHLPDCAKGLKWLRKSLKKVKS